MATILPFQGLRYDTRKINGPLAQVVAPPYDVISVEQQDGLYKRSPHNVVRLILGRQYDGDGPSDNRYTRSAKTLSDWEDEGVLAEDVQPTFYVYEQTFTFAAAAAGASKPRVRRGVLAALKLEPFGKGCVYPHEETFSAPKADRFNLMRACRANFSPVFGLAPDPDGVIAKLLAGAAQRAPDAEVQEDDGVKDRMWAVTQPEFHAALTKAFEAKNLFIADGHHRYETACAYREERRAHDSNPANKSRFRSYDYVLMMCVPMSDPGLLVLPTHRLLKNLNGFQPSKFLNQASELFEHRSATEAELLALAEEESGPVRIGAVFSGGQRAILTVKPAVAAAMAKLTPAHGAAWRELDVAILHEVFLKGLLGLSEERVLRKEGVTYTKDAREAITLAGQGAGYELAFILRPTRVDQVKAVAEAGEKMPQKSTYFYPKLLSGLVMRKL